MKREHTEPIMINLPISLIASMTKYINERRFESYSDMAKEAIQLWIDCEEWFELARHIDRLEADLVSDISFECDDGPVRKSEIFEVATLDGENAHPGMKRR